MAKKKKKNGRAPIKGPGPQAPPEATHFAVPLMVFQATVKVLETLPWNQVSPLMAALQNCQPLSIPEDSKIGAKVPGLDREEG